MLIGIAERLSVFQLVGAWERGAGLVSLLAVEEGDCYGRGGVFVFLRFFLLSFFFFLIYHF